jgi:hypothetical protein
MSAPTPTLDTADLVGVLASPRAASELTSVPELRILGLMHDRLVRTERVQGQTVVRVDDCAREATHLAKTSDPRGDFANGEPEVFHPRRAAKRG